MSKEYNYINERNESWESKEQMELNEIYYNCSECSSSVEILSINEKESNIEFKCINNNHKIKMLIKDYLDKMKKFNNKDLNNDVCKIHNKKYEYYCIDCYEHLCKECLKLKKHINHNKNIILEVQPNEQQLNIINNMIKYYEDNIANLERENIKKTEELKNQLKLYKDELNKRNELKINENKNKF